MRGTIRAVWAAMVITVLGASPAVAAPPSAAAETPAQLTFSRVPGISRDVVASIAQDRAGFLWIGTGDGLARYDGYRLQIMEREGGDAVARNMGWVRAMAPARDGRLWIGTESQGLAVHEPDSGRIRAIGALGGEGAPLAPVVGLLEDHNGDVWMATQGGGLQRYRAADGGLETVRLPGLYDGSGRVSAVHEDAQGTLWVGYWNGLARRRPGERVFSAVALPPEVEGDPVTRLHSDPQGHLWFGTQAGRIGWWHADAPAAQWLPEGPLPRSAINALRLGADGLLWVGHRFGIELIEPRSGRLVQQLRSRAGDPLGLAGTDVTSLWLDREGAMWVGGFGLGLQRHRQHPAVRVRGADADPTSPLAAPDTRALLGLRDGRVLAATHGGGLALLDPGLRLLKRWPREGRGLVALSQAVDGSLWMGGPDGVEHWSLDGRVLRRWPAVGGIALRLLAGPDGTVWMGAQQGLFRLRPGGAAFEPVPVDGDPRPALERDIHGMALDSAGTLWVGGLAGLHRLPPGAPALQPVPAAPGEGLGQPTVFGLVVDARDGLWVDTPIAGLHRLIGRDAQGRARFERISVRHGLVGRPFGANLEVDAQGRIWSQHFVYDPLADRLDEIAPSDGAVFGTPWFRSHTKTADGRLLFGGSRGILQLQPDAFTAPPAPPALAFTRLRINGLPQQPPGWRAGLRLPAGTQSFGVEYAGLALDDAQRLRYRHRLVGEEADWIPSDASFRSPSYSNLAPGRYRLQVQVRSGSGPWSEALELPVEMLPAWWQRVPVQIAGAALALLATWGVLQLRTRQLRRRKAELEGLVEQRTAALRETSLSDPLTGLRNRRYLAQRIEADLHEARHGEDLLLFLLDLDHFKRVNDQLGHDGGDELLATVAQRLAECVGARDVLLRWGGDTFLLLLPARARAEAPQLARRLLAAVRDTELERADGRRVAPRCSVGWVAYPPLREQPEAWSWSATLDLVDAAVFDAKARGRDRAVGLSDSAGLRPEELGAEPGRWLLDPRLRPRVDS